MLFACIALKNLTECYKSENEAFQGKFDTVCQYILKQSISIRLDQ
jgi:hypothetical protein